MIYFTSDLHLGHRGIITMRDRPFSDVDDMNRCLLRNYNAVVHKDDTVYILGDICHHMAVEEANRWIARMNGKKVLLIGNHDKQYDPALFVEIREFMTVSLSEFFAFREIKEVLRRLLPASVHLICLSLNIISIRGLPWWLRQ